MNRVGGQLVCSNNFLLKENSRKHSVFGLIYKSNCCKDTVIYILTNINSFYFLINRTLRSKKNTHNSRKRFKVLFLTNFVRHENKDLILNGPKIIFFDVCLKNDEISALALSSFLLLVRMRINLYSE